MYKNGVNEMIEYGIQSMIGKLKRVLIKHPKDAFINQEYLNKNWRTYNYSSCPDFGKAFEEYQQFEKILRNFVPKIDYLPYYNETVGLDSIYTHDTVKITKKGAVMLKMGKDLRRNEPIAVKTYLKELGIPILGSITGNGIVEGGDLIWLDDKTLAIGRGYRTNDEGIIQLKKILTDLVEEYIVVQLPHGHGPDECLHLMSLVSLIDKDLAVVYSKFLPVFFRDILLGRGIQLLEVPDEEFFNLGSNILTLAPRICVMAADNRITKNLLEDEGVEVFEYSGYEISLKGTGGPTCLTCPVVRESVT